MIGTGSVTKNITRWQHSHGCLLYFHRVAPWAAWRRLPGRDFYVSAEFLDRLLGYLISIGWRIVTIDEVIGRYKRGEDGSDLINFSLDDCYRDTFDVVVPLFRKHGVPLTLFVTTGIPDHSQNCGLVLGRAGLESLIGGQDRLIHEGQEINVSTFGAKRYWFATISRRWEKGSFKPYYMEFCAANCVDPDELSDKHAITWDMLATFRNDPLVEICAHTVSHPRLSALKAQDALLEMVESAERLRSRLGVACSHIAFPFGGDLDCSARDYGLAREAGFASAATTRRGLLKPNQDLFSLPRNPLGGAHRSIAYVEAKIAGLTAIAAKVLTHDKGNAA